MSSKYKYYRPGYTVILNQDIVKEWAMNPQGLPEKLRGKLDDKPFNQLMLFSKGLSNMTDIIQWTRHRSLSRKNPKRKRPTNQ